MSLINDALRRASQSDKDRARATPSLIRMEPAPVAQRSVMPWILAMGVVIALVLASWFFWQGAKARQAAVDKVVVVVPPPKIEPVHEIAPVIIVPPKPAPVVVQPAPAPAPPPPVVVKEAPEPWPSDLKLKGIFYNRTNPRALINGRSLAVGDTVEGARVAKIEPDQVTLEWKGQTQILLEGQ
jgi:type II secretory pathway component PulC